MSTEDRLRQVFADVFGLDATEVSRDDSVHTVPGWDSVAHLNLILAVEGEFAVQFAAEEIPELVSFEAIHSRLAGVENAGT